MRFPLFIAALMLSASAAPALAAPTVAAQQSVIVPLYLHGNRPLAMLTIGGHVPSPIVFDTGTDENIVSQALADHLKLKKTGTSPLIDLGSGKSTIVPVVALPDPKIGGVALTVKTAQVLARNVPDEVGIFGPYSFGDAYVILEAGLNRIRLVPRDSGLRLPGPGIPYETTLPSIPISVGGMILNAHVDSGNSGELILGGDLKASVPMAAPPQVVGIAVSALGEQEVYGGQLKADVQVGPISLTNPDVTFSQSGKGANVGFPIVRQLTLILDPANKRSWILNPATDPVSLADFAGTFGPRRLWVENGILFHQRDGRPKFELRYLGGDLFDLGATGDRIQFFRSRGRVTRLELITVEDDVVGADRSG